MESKFSRNSQQTVWRTKSSILNYVFTNKVIFTCLILFRILSALFNHISDCDETFNYLEPIHFLNYGTGMQTWEYSPKYAIRSYLYLWFYASIIHLANLISFFSKLTNFYILRIGLAIFCSLCEILFYKGLYVTFGEVSKFAILFQIFSAGMFNSSTSVLPNTFSMYFIYAMLGAYLLKKYKFTLFCIGCTSLIGWPFSALICIPVILQLLHSRRRWFILKWGTFFAMILILMLITVDSYYYGKFVIAPLNIVKYNVFTSHGANLYGVEPPSYYFINSFLNFNLAFIYALLSPFLYLFISQLNYVFEKKLSMMSIVVMYGWLILFTVQAHKEERFLFPIYPFICLNSAFTIHALSLVLKKVFHVGDYQISCLQFKICLTFILLSFSRILAIYTGYHAPLDTFAKFSIIDKLHNNEQQNNFTICLGKEWFRYPSSFFLPSERWHLKFLKSNFTGQLPQPFATNYTYPTRYLQANFNDQNKEEQINRYLDSNDCDFIVDSENTGEYNPETGNVFYSKISNSWQIIYSTGIISSLESNKFLRAFYVPYFTNLTCVYTSFHILSNRIRMAKTILIQ